MYVSGTQELMADESKIIREKTIEKVKNREM